MRTVRIPLRVWLGAVALGLAWAWLAAPIASAQPTSCLEFGDVTVRDGERRDCDLNVVGGDLVIESGGEVVGSANVPLGDATIAGIVGADAYAGGDLAVTGTIGGDAFAAGDLTVDGEVKGDASALGRVTVAGTGTVDGDAESLGGDAEVNGAVNGSARAAQGALILGATAVVQGRTEAGGEIRRTDGAQVFEQADPVAEAPTPGMRGASFLLRLFLVASMVFFVALFAGLTVAVAPGAVGNVRDAAGGSAMRSIVVGGLLLLVFPLLMWLVIPVLLYAVGACLGAVALGELLGRRLLGERSRVLRTALGTGLLALVLALAMIVGYGSFLQLCLILSVTSIFTMVVIAWGLGASTLTLLGSRRWPHADRPSGPGEAAVEPPSGAAPSPEAEAAPVAPVVLAGATGVGAAVAGGADVGAADAGVAAGEGTALAEGTTLGEAATVAGAAVLMGAMTDSDDWPVEETPDLPAVGFDVAAPAAPAAAAAVGVAAAAAADQPADAQPAAAFSELEPAAFEPDLLPAAVAAELVPAEAEPVPAEPESTPAEPEAAPGEADAAPVQGTAELRRVPGITPIYAQLLFDGGLRTVGDLAQATPEQLVGIASAPGVQAISADTAGQWIRNARGVLGMG